MFIKLSSLILALCLTIFNVANAYAECACMQHKDPSVLMQEEQLRARTLQSESQRTIARNFWHEKLNFDAGAAYTTAVDKAVAELADARKLSDTGTMTAVRFEALLAHTADIQREAADYFRSQNELGTAARHLESALANEVEAKADSGSLADHYDELAQLYEAAHQYSKAAEFYKKRIQLAEQTKGRYSPEVAQLTAHLQQLASK